MSTNWMAPFAVRKETARRFMDTGVSNRAIFGCTQLGKQVAGLFEAGVFIDDTLSGTFFCGVPVIGSSEVPKGTIVLSTITGVAPVSVSKLLDGLGLECVDFFAFDSTDHGGSLDARFHTGWKEFTIHNLARYEYLLSKFADSESRMTLVNLVNFRLTGDLSWMAAFTDRQEEQYFSRCIDLSSPGHVFLDIGAFDGTTSVEFSKRSPSYQSIHGFEPSPTSLVALKENFANLERAQIHPYGVSDFDGVVRFEEDGSSSRVSSVGVGVEVEVKSLDGIFDENPTIVKIDIEGGELDALRGMRSILEKNPPAFALAAYHHPGQLLELFEFVAQIKLGYQPYLRHYTEGTTETVLYMIPKND
jgi:FkbM family methyltransferase